MITCKEYAIHEKEMMREIIKDRYNNFPPELLIIQVGDNPASNTYIKGKLNDCKEVGIRTSLMKFDENVCQQEIINFLEVYAKRDCGVIIQLPLPQQLNVKEIIEASNIKPCQDVDGLYYDFHRPCTPLGIMNWLDDNEISLDGKTVLIINRSDLVGKPLAKMMLEKDATVIVCHSHTPQETIEDLAWNADIIVTATGKARWFDPYNVKPAQDEGKAPIIIDVGISRDNYGNLCGDVDTFFFEDAEFYDENKRVITPVPDGVGLLTRIGLLENVINCHEAVKDDFRKAYLNDR